MMQTSLKDFPDFFQPMLVKELRQGLRTRGFVLMFLAFHLIMAVVLWIAISSYNVSSAGNMTNDAIFSILLFALVVVQPLRAQNAISIEVKANTLELITMTSMNARRIVVGKWLSLVVQSLLLIVSILPYVVISYLLGGVNLLNELVKFALLFLASSALIAGVIGLSSSMTRIIPIMIILFVFSAQGLMGMIFSGRSVMPEFDLQDPQFWLFVLLFLISISYLAWSAMTLGMHLIAPAAENHISQHRIIALALTFFVSVSALTWLTLDLEAILAGFLMVLIPVMVLALNERDGPIDSVKRRFTRLGIVGKIVSLLILPGWPTAVFLSGVIAAIAGWTVLRLSVSNNIHEEFVVFVSAVVGAIWLSSMFVTLFTRDRKKRFGFALAVMILLATLAFLSAFLYDSNETRLVSWFFAWNPLSYFGYYMNSASDKSQILMLSVGVTISIYLIFAVIALIKRSNSKPATLPSEPL